MCNSRYMLTQRHRARQATATVGATVVGNTSLQLLLMQVSKQTHQAHARLLVAKQQVVLLAST